MDQAFLTGYLAFTTTLAGSKSDEIPIPPAMSSPMMDEATIWFLTVTDNRGAIVSSELEFSTK